MSNVTKFNLMHYIRRAVFENRLMFLAVTSSAQGAVESEGFAFGEGKSHCGMGLSCSIFQEAYNIGEEEAEEYVKQNMGYNADDVMNMVKRGMKNRIPCWISDDMEVAFGKHKSYDNKFREMAYFMQTVRPYCAVFIGTMPDFGQIARAWRDLFMFEIKVPFRGYLEVQKIKRWSDFYDPLDPNIKLEYGGEQPFPPCSDRMKAWYEPWRDSRVRQEHARIYDTYFKEKDPDPAQKSELSQAASALVRHGWDVHPIRQRREKFPILK